MRRYRVLKMDFDARANVLSIEIADDWEPQVKALWLRNKEQVCAEIAAEFGELSLERKLDDFRSIGAAPFSVVAFHNAFYRQARDAFTLGAYYPALTATCALGERILNHMILLFREDFQHAPEYKRVYRKQSFDDWNVAIETLVAWKLFLPATAQAFRELRDIRNRSIHFNPETDKDSRAEALRALGALHSIIDLQFTAFGNQPWFIENDTGISFIRRRFEADPFVAKVILPSCALLGPAHRLSRDTEGEWVASDPEESPALEISDEDYIELFKKRQTES